MQYAKQNILTLQYMNSKALTFPIASNPLSKKKTIPRKEKNIPNPVNPSPISVLFHNNKK